MAVAGIALVTAVFVWWPDDEPPPAPVADPVATVEPRPDFEPLRAPDPEPAPPVREPAHVTSTSDIINPCDPFRPVKFPTGFEQLTVGPVTVMWQSQVAKGPSDVRLRPASLARYVVGIIDEASASTGTPPLQSIAIVIYPGDTEFHELTGAPPWSQGFYDGAVHLPYLPAEELGVRLSALRHELMHAQLHPALACAPIWLHEGLAAWFSDRAYLPEWLAMLKSASAIDFALLSKPMFPPLVRSETVGAYYAQSLAMVMLGRERAKGDLRAFVGQFIAAPAADDSERLQFWSLNYKDVDGRALLDFLSRKLFGAGWSGELHQALRLPVCCSGLQRLDELKCRFADRSADGGVRSGYVDSSQSPPMLCRAAGWSLIR